MYLRVLFLAAPLTFTYINCEFAMRAAATRGLPVDRGRYGPLQRRFCAFLIYGLGPFPRLEVLVAGLAAFLRKCRGGGVSWLASAGIRACRSRSRAARIDWTSPAACSASVFRGWRSRLPYASIYLFMSGIAARLGPRELACSGLAEPAESATSSSPTALRPRPLRCRA